MNSSLFTGASESAMQFTIYEYLKKTLRADDDTAPDQGGQRRRDCCERYEAVTQATTSISLTRHPAPR